jgi:hypothetical protein
MVASRLGIKVEWMRCFVESRHWNPTVDWLLFGDAPPPICCRIYVSSRTDADRVCDARSAMVTSTSPSSQDTTTGVW